MEWFLLKSGKVEGPISDEEFMIQLRSGTLSDSDLACKKGSTHWSSIPEIEKELQSASPAEPDIKPWILLIEKADDPKTAGNESPYTQRGPFKTDEIVEQLRTGEARYSDYVWKTGFERWTRINEIDEFFEHDKENSSGQIAEVAAPEEETKKIQILEQAKAVSQLDFVENGAGVAAVMAIDEAAVKPMTIDLAIDAVTAEANTNLDLKNQESALSSFEFKLDLDRENSKRDEKVLAPEDSHEKSFMEKAELNLLPWVLGSLSVAMVGLIMVWYSQREKIPLTPVTNQTAPAVPRSPPKAKEEPKPLKQFSDYKNERSIDDALAPEQKPIEKKSVEKVAASKINRNPTSRPVHKKTLVKGIHKVQKKQLLKTVLLLERKAESLDQKYNSLKDSPLSWRRFYSQWQQEIKSTALQTDPAAYHYVKSLTIGKNRLIERAAMMDRSIVQEVPVSSDFRNENLAETFRKLAKKIRE